MEIFLMYLKVFAVGGAVCVIGQLLINYTKMTSARILVLFLLSGVLLEAVGAFKYIEEFAGAGITIPIVGFGALIARGAIEGASQGLLQAVTNGMAMASAGLTSAIVFGFIMAAIFKSHTKKM